MVTLYSVDAHRITAQKVADDFAATYWEEPRQAEPITDKGMFQLIDGDTIYQVIYVPAKRFETFATYQITKIKG